MNTERIIQNEGYRLEDLSAHNQDVMKWLRFVEEEFEEHVEGYLDLSDNNSIIEKITNEIAADALNEAVVNLHLIINEIQISLAENE